MQQSLVFDPDLIGRYDKAGPRYTSYPTAVQFHTGFGDVDYRRAAAASNTETRLRPLSLYFHIPFCSTVCFYCGCNKVVTKRREKAAPYLEHLHKEIAMQAELFADAREVVQLHWGGGTPTFISTEQMRELMEVTRQHFRLMDGELGEYSIEIDPREVQDDTLAVLRELGFNRISLGVQDFNAQVQKAVNRVQPESQTLAVLEEARRLGFGSINVDLIYGLPHQSVATFGETIDKIIDASPDRLSVFNYAHMPELFKPQRRINAADLPSATEKLSMLGLTIGKLAEAGYVYIGMDHFAKPDDELAQAQRDRTLYRNFQGYSTHADCDLVAMGPTAIGMVGRTYAQNVKTLDEYYARINEGRLPVFRGIELDGDDLLRRDVITRLICHFELMFDDIESRYAVNFAEYFSRELREIDGMEADGLLRRSADGIEVLPQGRLLIRNICMVFDRYLRTVAPQRYSKVI